MHSIHSVASILVTWRILSLMTASAVIVQVSRRFFFEFLPRNSCIVAGFENCVEAFRYFKKAFNSCLRFAFALIGHNMKDDTMRNKRKKHSQMEHNRRTKARTT